MSGLRRLRRSRSTQEEPEKTEEPQRDIPDLTGTILSDFELGKTLGTGTFGRVRLCYHSSVNAPLAIKMLKKSEIIRLKQVEHIMAEKTLLHEIYHPFIVNMYHHFQDEHNLYMIFEFIVGGELFTHLRRAGNFSNETAKFYSAEIVLAFQYLHDRTIVYRDLKPENLLLDITGHMKITDFGFAKKVEDRTWTLCGTPEYLAPEIIQSKGHNKAVDWWALGVLIYEMLAGYPPFYDENPFGIYQKILSGRIDFPRSFDIQAKDIIRRFLTPDRSKRIGCLKNAAEDVKRHKWYRGIDWRELYDRSIPAPIQPEVSGPDDTCQFDDYPESDCDPPIPLMPGDAEQFRDF